MENCLNVNICGNARLDQSFYCQSCLKLQAEVTESCQKNGITNRYEIQNYIQAAYQKVAEKKMQLFAEQRAKRIEARQQSAEPSSGIVMDEAELQRRQKEEMG